MSFEQAFKNIDDVLWKEDMSGELDYIEQTSWLLFLKYLDDLEAEKVMEAELAEVHQLTRSNFEDLSNIFTRNPNWFLHREKYNLRTHIGKH